MLTGPVKAINSYEDFECFKKSQAITDVLDFVKKCAEGAVGTQNNTDVLLSEWPAIEHFVHLMGLLFSLVDEVPPIKQPMRFGNKAFRNWHSRMVELGKTSLVSLSEILEKPLIVDELLPYLAEMFGNPTRIDYGTGHELNFAVYFLVLTKLGGLPDTKEVHAVLVTKAFASYIRTMRRLQIDYMLEPAGSHGVWGLDDYHCLLFLWGAAQLSNQKDISPSDIHDVNCLKEHAPEYLYFEGIQFIKHIKAGAPFAETSPMLNDISALQEWAKICSGLMRLFQAEVLQKFPVIQHLLFGSVLKCTWSAGGTAGTGTGTGHNNAFTSGGPSGHITRSSPITTHPYPHTYPHAQPHTDARTDPRTAVEKMNSISPTHSSISTSAAPPTTNAASNTTSTDTADIPTTSTDEGQYGHT